MIFNFFGNQKEKYKVAILTGSQNLATIEKEYVDKIGHHDEIIMVPTDVQPKRTSKAVLRPFWDSIEPELKKMGVEVLVIADGDYFKHITKLKKTETYLGIMVEGSGFKCFYAPSTRAIFYDPEGVREKIRICTDSVIKYLSDTYVEPGSDIIHHSEFRFSTEHTAIQTILNRLHKHPSLTCDIETYSLKFYDGGIGSISFAWNKHEGVAFMVENSPVVMEMLKEFFETYQGELIFHNASFDVTSLIYNLWMKKLNNQEGLLEGLEIMCKRLVCTMVMTYLATNSCAGNELGLKAQAQEFAGNYAEDVKDITLLDRRDLLIYNLKDTLSTWFVYEKHGPTLIQDKQEGIYLYFMAWLKDIIHMQLTGMPINLKRVGQVKRIVQGDMNHALDIIYKSRHVRKLTNIVIDEEVHKYNTTRKVKRITRDDVDYTFNPGSDDQMSRLLYEIMGLPVLDLTKSKNPATGSKTIKKLINHIDDPSDVELLTALMEYSDASIILNTFISAFEEAPYCPERQMNFLFGNFILGGTVSGRLSSRNPNMQNLPANSKYAPLVKSCFVAPEGWLFIGIDADSLEDKISALTTKDPAKLQVYIDGFDGHSLRAYAYFGEQMPDIIEGDVDSINSISKRYPQLRQDSKDPTFACTYGGTFRTMVKNLGWPEDKARLVENRYKELYKVSVEWVRKKIEQATRDGFVTVAFGLRVRTPILHSTVLGSRATPFEAEAEARTAGNALGQSYCMLNNRAVNEFLEDVRTSEYRLDILPCAQIHDASYYMVRACPEVLEYANRKLVQAYAWQDLPEIQHDIVKLSGSVDIFYPTWEHGHTIPREANLEDIIKLGEDIANV